MTDTRESTQRVIPEKANRMARAILRKPESEDCLKELGECLDFARRSVGWTLDQLAKEIGRDERQVRRWIDGDERTQVDTVFAAKQLRGPFVVALARLVSDDCQCPDVCEEQTVLTFRRRV